MRYISKQSHIAQNITKKCQNYFQSFIAVEILPQHFCQLFQNIGWSKKYFPIFYSCLNENLGKYFVDHPIFHCNITILTYWNIFVNK